MVKKIKKEVIIDLRYISKKLEKSPGRRDIPIHLYKNCCKHFGSLNKAKEIAGLSIFKRKCKPLTKKSMKFSKELAKIVSYLTFDGHLHKDLKGFLLSSSKLKVFNDFNNLVNKQFNINFFKIQEVRHWGYISYNIRYFNTKVSKFLYLIGTPKGDKMITKFDVPCWIRKNKRFSKEYLKIAYYCEGSICKHSKNSYRIDFNINKCEEILDDGLKFLESMKEMLYSFGIKTTKTYIMKREYKREKDSKITRLLRFNIKPESTDKFIKEIGWLK